MYVAALPGETEQVQHEIKKKKASVNLIITDM